MIDFREVEALKRVKKHHGCGIVNNTLAKHQTVEERSLILIKHLHNERQLLNPELIGFSVVLEYITYPGASTIGLKFW